MSAEEMLGRQFVPPNPAKTYYGSAFRMTAEQRTRTKGYARQQLGLARQARKEGRPGQADAHLRDAAVYRDQAFAGATAQYTPYRTHWRYGDVPDTRRLP